MLIEEARSQYKKAVEKLTAVAEKEGRELLPQIYNGIKEATKQGKNSYFWESKPELYREIEFLDKVLKNDGYTVLTGYPYPYHSFYDNELNCKYGILIKGWDEEPKKPTFIFTPPEPKKSWWRQVREYWSY